MLSLRKLAQTGTNWHKLTQTNTNWDKVGQTGANWDKVSSMAHTRWLGSAPTRFSTECPRSSQFLPVRPRFPQFRASWGRVLPGWASSSQFVPPHHHKQARAGINWNEVTQTRTNGGILGETGGSRPEPPSLRHTAHLVPVCPSLSHLVPVCVSLRQFVSVCLSLCQFAQTRHAGQA